MTDETALLVAAGVLAGFVLGGLAKELAPVWLQWVLFGLAVVWLVSPLEWWR